MNVKIRNLEKRTRMRATQNRRKSKSTVASRPGTGGDATAKDVSEQRLEEVRSRNEAGHCEEVTDLIGDDLAAVIENWKADDFTSSSGGNETSNTDTAMTQEWEEEEDFEEEGESAATKNKNNCLRFFVFGPDRKARKRRKPRLEHQRWDLP